MVLIEKEIKLLLSRVPPDPDHPGMPYKREEVEVCWCSPNIGAA